jgi:hypothetical protein
MISCAIYPTCSKEQVVSYFRADQPKEKVYGFRTSIPFIFKRTTGLEVGRSLGILLTPVSIPSSVMEQVRGREMFEKYQVSDLGLEILKKINEKGKTDIPNFPEIEILNPALDGPGIPQDIKKNLYVEKNPYLLVRLWDVNLDSKGIRVRGRGSQLAIKTIGADNCCWIEKSIDYKKPYHNKISTIEELEKEDGKLFKEEVLFVADQIASDFIEYLKGLMK